MKKSYEEIVGLIENSRRFGSLPGVETARRALSCLGEPMEGIPFIHVAGTNGKGSVCAFLTEILRRAGLRTGTFTSPHLIRFEERITVNAAPITEEDVERLGNFILEQDYGVSLSMFDYCLLMAVLYFREQGCEAAVIETGLGGRLDATNALGVPEVAVLTHIGLDHTAILGDSLAEIAGEKAGIIKPDCYVVAGSQEEPEVLEVFAQAVSRCPGAKLVTVSGETMHAVERIPMRMQGLCQRENAAVAYLAAEEFLRRHTEIPEKERQECCRTGIASATWPGRMQILSHRPFLLVDGAHNPQGVRAMAGSLRALYPGERFHFLMGVMADKDYAAMLPELDDLAESYVTVTVENERAMQAEQLAGVIRERGFRAKSVENLKEALEFLPMDHKSVAFGSLYFVGEVLRRWEILNSHPQLEERIR